VAADYDGDGKADVAVLETALVSEPNASRIYGVAFGFADDKPVPADYDGDGKSGRGGFPTGKRHVVSTAVASRITGIQFGFGTDCQFRRITTATAKRRGGL
jgi:hypothetical protein